MHSYRSQGIPKAVTPWFELTGLQSTAHGPQAPIEIDFVASDNPITKGFANWTTINEELYNTAPANCSVGNRSGARSANGEEQERSGDQGGLRRWRGRTIIAEALKSLPPRWDITIGPSPIRAIWIW